MAIEKDVLDQMPAGAAIQRRVATQCCHKPYLGRATSVGEDHQPITLTPGLGSPWWLRIYTFADSLVIFSRAART